MIESYITFIIGVATGETIAAIFVCLGTLSGMKEKERRKNERNKK